MYYVHLLEIFNQCYSYGNIRINDRDNLAQRHSYEAAFTTLFLM